MDIAMPGMDGMETTKCIKSQYPDVQILALTMLEDERYFFQIVQAGASGFIIKGALPDELLSAVRAVAAGNVYLYPALAKNLAGEYLSQAKRQWRGAGRRSANRPRARNPSSDLARANRQRDWRPSGISANGGSAPREPDGETESAQPDRAGEVRDPQGPGRCRLTLDDPTLHLPFGRGAG